ncbi:hypothetical protein AAVH_22497, partial [Aphelenchoides avenae]
MQWVLKNLNDPAAVTSLASQKQEAYKRIYDTVLSQMSKAILDRMQEAKSTHMGFGRDSDYGEAMEAQQTLAKDRDDLLLQVEGYKKQVEHLKESDAEWYAKCTELQYKCMKTQKDLLASQNKVAILDAVTSLLGTDDANVVSELDDSARIQDLERQLRAAQDANVKLQQIVADQQKQLPSGSGGARQSLVERARDIGFVFDSSGKLQLGPAPSQVFEISKPYCYTN